MDPLITAALIGGAGSLLGGFGQNASNAKEAQKNRDFQLMMSNTAHQRQVKDMRAAGLNPILSATGGSGASTGSGAQANMVNPAAGAAESAAKAAQAAMAKKEGKILDANKINTDANTNLTDQKALESKENVKNIEANTNATEAARVRDNMLSYSQIELLKAQQKQVVTASEESALRRDLLMTQMPAALNQAAKDSTWYGRNIAPYLNDAKTLNNVFTPTKQKGGKR